MEDLALMKSVALEKTPSVNFDLVIDEKIFMKTWRINSTVAKSAICLLAQCQPRSFLSGGKVDLGDTLSAYNARQFHHIYPKAFLGSLGIPFHESNVIANVCLLTASDNNHISDKNPKDYFEEIPSSQREDIFRSALMPQDCRDGSKPYAEFLSQRASALAVAASQLVKHGRLVSPAI